MRALIDTNVLLDFLLGREPYFSNADIIMKLCADRKIQGGDCARGFFEGGTILILKTDP